MKITNFSEQMYFLLSLEMSQADWSLVFPLRVTYIKEILYSLLSITRMSCWGGKDVKSGLVDDLVWCPDQLGLWLLEWICSSAAISSCGTCHSSTNTCRLIERCVQPESLFFSPSVRTKRDLWKDLHCSLAGAARLSWRAGYESWLSCRIEDKTVVLTDCSIRAVRLAPSAQL